MPNSLSSTATLECIGLDRKDHLNMNLLFDVLQKSFDHLRNKEGDQRIPVVY